MSWKGVPIHTSFLTYPRAKRIRYPSVTAPPHDMEMEGSGIPSVGCGCLRVSDGPAVARSCLARAADLGKVRIRYSRGPDPRTETRKAWAGRVCLILIGTIPFTHSLFGPLKNRARVKRKTHALF